MFDCQRQDVTFWEANIVKLVKRGLIVTDFIQSAWPRCCLWLKKKTVFFFLLLFHDWALTECGASRNVLTKGDQCCALIKVTTGVPSPSLTSWAWSSLDTWTVFKVGGSARVASVQVCSLTVAARLQTSAEGLAPGLLQINITAVFHHSKWHNCSVVEPYLNLHDWSCT